MKKFAAVILCSLLVSSIPNFGINAFADNTNAKPILDVQLPNPFIECETIEDAEKTAGFNIALPTNIPKEFDNQTIFAIENDFIDVHYESDDSTLTIRKTNVIEDCSGDFNKYSVVTKIVVNGEDILLKCKDDKVYTAIWNDGTYSYSISIDNDSVGLDKDVVTELINEMK